MCVCWGSIHCHERWDAGPGVAQGDTSLLAGRQVRHSSRRRRKTRLQRGLSLPLTGEPQTRVKRHWPAKKHCSRTGRLQVAPIPYMAASHQLTGRRCCTCYLCAGVMSGSTPAGLRASVVVLQPPLTLHTGNCLHMLMHACFLVQSQSLAQPRHPAHSLCTRMHAHTCT